MAALKNATETFKLMSETSAEKSEVPKDANDDALFSRFYVMKLRKELPRSTQIPPIITIDEEEAEEEEELEEGLGRNSSFYGTLNFEC